jgi:hypothetical protein
MLLYYNYCHLFSLSPPLSFSLLLSLAMFGTRNYQIICNKIKCQHTWNTQIQYNIQHYNELENQNKGTRHDIDSYAFHWPIMGITNCIMFINMSVWNSRSTYFVRQKTVWKEGRKEVSKEGSKQASKQARKEDLGTCMSLPILQAAPLLEENSTHHLMCYLNKVYFMKTYIFQYLLMFFFWVLSFLYSGFSWLHYAQHMLIKTTII